MIPLDTAFIGLVIFFGIVGALRGWARELLVVFSVVLARFIEVVLLDIVPVVGPALKALDPRSWFYVRMAIFVFIVFFGYATPVLSSSLGAKARKDKFQDTLLGFFIGFINGFLVVGMFWGYINELGYNLWGITPPTSERALALLQFLPLYLFTGPLLFVSVAIAFAFVLIVFV